jgi:hypothetical protein
MNISKTHNMYSALIVGAITIIGLVGCVKAMSEQTLQPNGGLNGSFETTKNQMPVNWLLYTPKTTPNAHFTMQLDTTDPKEGKQSLQFRVQDCRNTGGWLSPGFAQELPVKPQETYKISFWVKNHQSQFQIKISSTHGNKAHVGRLSRSNEEYTHWQEFTYEYTIPEGMDKLRLEANILKPGITSFDAISVEKVR